MWLSDSALSKMGGASSTIRKRRVPVRAGFSQPPDRSRSRSSTAHALAPIGRDYESPALTLQSQPDSCTTARDKPPSGQRAITSRWVLRKKFKADGTVARHKSRLVIRGFEQKLGIDYFSTFASVIRYVTLRILLAKAAAEDLEADHLDIDTAFCNPTIDEDIYVEIPQFFERIYPELKRAKDKYLKLNKTLYGLKQAPRAWFLMVKKFFEDLGLRSSQADPNLFTGCGVFILLYVDDILIIGKREQVDKIKQKIKARWKHKDLGPVECFVGFQIHRNRRQRTLRIHQTHYITKLLERLRMDQANPTKLPIPAGTVLKDTGEEPLNPNDTTVSWHQPPCYGFTERLRY